MARILILAINHFRIKFQTVIPNTCLDNLFKQLIGMSGRQIFVLVQMLQNISEWSITVSKFHRATKNTLF